MLGYLQPLRIIGYQDLFAFQHVFLVTQHNVLSVIGRLGDPQLKLYSKCSPFLFYSTFHLTCFLLKKQLD